MIPSRDSSMRFFVQGFFKIDNSALYLDFNVRMVWYSLLFTEIFEYLCDDPAMTVVAVSIRVMNADEDTSTVVVEH
jgi:hypothetical protein